MAEKNAVLAVNGGTLSGHAVETERDENFSTHSAVLEVNPGSNNKTSDFLWTSAPKYVNSIKFKFSGTGSGTATNRVYFVSLLISGSWVEVWRDGDSGITSPTYTVTMTTGWQNVTGVRCFRSVYSSLGVSRAYFYEVSVFYNINKSYAGVVT